MHTPYDDYLIEAIKDDRCAEAYMKAALEEDDPRVFLLVLRTVAQARGIGKVAAKSKLNREMLWSGRRCLPPSRLQLRVSLRVRAPSIRPLLLCPGVPSRQIGRGGLRGVTPVSESESARDLLDRLLCLVFLAVRLVAWLYFD